MFVGKLVICYFHYENCMLLYLSFCHLMVYSERLKLCKLPTLHYRQIRRDVIELYKILSEKYDVATITHVTKECNYSTRGNDLRLEKSRTKYDLRKYYFTNRVVNIWNSLLTMLYYVTLLIHLNLASINSGNTSTLCMIAKLKFTELEAEVYMFRIAYIITLI